MKKNQIDIICLQIYYCYLITKNINLGFPKHFSENNPGFFRKGQIGNWKKFL